MSIKSIRLVLEDSLMVVGLGSESQSCATPAALWQAVSQIADQDEFLHLAGPDQVPNKAALQRAAFRLAESGAVAAIGAVRDARGQVTAPLRPSSAEFAPVAAGSAVVLVRALRNLRWGHHDWDDFSLNDLMTALHRAGPILRLDDVIATGGQTSAHGLLPIARAGDGFDPAVPTVIVLSPPDATCALYFDQFRSAQSLNLRILPPLATGAALTWLSQAAAVVISREVAALMEDGTIALLHGLGIAVFWFLDDDVFALGAEYPAFAPYLSADFRPMERGISGILAATSPLAAALHDRLGLPQTPDILPPAPAVDWPLSEGANGAVAAIIGGIFRGAGLRDIVLPALRLAAPQVQLVAHDNLRPFLTAATARFVPFEGDFFRFLHLWQAMRPALLIHPPGQSANMPNKSDATVFVAHVLGAVPVVADEPAFAGWDESKGVVVVALGGWEDALRRATDPAYAAMLRARLKGEVERRQREAPDLLALLGNPVAVSAIARDLRLQRLFEAPPVQPAMPARRSIWARLRRSLWRRGLLPGDQPPKIASR